MTDLSVTAPSAGMPIAEAKRGLIARPETDTPLSTASKGYQERRFQVVESAIWPNGRPADLHVSEHNRSLAKGFKARKWDAISVRHLQRLRGGR